MPSVIDKKRAGMVFALFLGLWHLVWALLVALGVGQFVIDWIFKLHFIQPPYVVTAFNALTAVILILVTSIIGFVLGWLFGAIWNWLHSRN